MQIKKCIYEDKLCVECGDCKCIYDEDKVCDNCMKCLDEADYNGIIIDGIDDGKGNIIKLNKKKN